MTSADRKGKTLVTAARDTALQEQQRLLRAQERAEVIQLSGREIVALHDISTIQTKLFEFFNYPTSLNRPAIATHSGARKNPLKDKGLKLLRLREFPIL